jgi:ADP-heptose:LPS heptosyltransferase
LASTSCRKAAGELLRQSIEGEPWNRGLALQLAREECSDALFRILIEGLADRFERRLCDAYVEIFSCILEQAFPEFHAIDLTARYQRIRDPQPVCFTPKRIAVLSRVTLGADIAVTSVLLDAAAARFPAAEIWFAGSAKSAELFHGFERVRHLNVPYIKGDLSQRLNAWRELALQFQEDDWLVIDPDSRLTQLGLLPIAQEDHYRFFESRAFGDNGPDTLTTLTQQWAKETFGVVGLPRIAPPALAPPFPGPYAAVSLGTADNPAKQMPAAFEAELIQEICAHFPNVIVDRGFGEEEAARVEHAIAGTNAKTFAGTFAAFASIIGNSACYVGYDSAGQHAAAAFGTPLITLFKGFVSDRMFARWQPSGKGPQQVLKIEDSLAITAITAALSSFSSFQKA